MASDLPGSDEPVVFAMRFKPTLPCAETRDLILDIPANLNITFAQSLRCLPEELEVFAVLELPDCGVAREYLAYQN
eukprot:2823469-Alexandrium_andersonii.AAC.1